LPALLLDIRGPLRERRATATNSISRPAGIQSRGLYVPAIELAAVNPPIWQIWQISTPENRCGDENEPLHRAAETPSSFMLDIPSDEVRMFKNYLAHRYTDMFEVSFLETERKLNDMALNKVLYLPTYRRIEKVSMAETNCAK
jgi:hypothetical protein